MALCCLGVLLSAVLLVCVGNCVNGQTSLSAADKRTLLDTHNRLRRAVDPPASNMQTMVRVQCVHAYMNAYTCACVSMCVRVCVCVCVCVWRGGGTPVYNTS